jgi:glucosamine 6-phosphate synthetase-like amidotransferase/phosphosugar isomerase protein
MQGARDVGAPVAAICDVDDMKTKQFANVSFTVMGSLPEELSPITYMIPGALFAIHLCSAQGKTKIESSQLHYEVNMRQLRHSEMRED